MTRRPPGSTRTDTLFPYTTLFRSHRKARRISASGPVRDAPAGWALGGRDPAAELRFRAAACRAPWRDARSSPRRRGTGTQRVCYAQRIPPEPAGSAARYGVDLGAARYSRSEEHTSELQSLMRISYAVFCLKKKNKIQIQ